MNERSGIITFKGNPFTLLGPELKVGDKAPDFAVVDNGLAPVSLASSAGKIRIISSVPSLDTPVCDTETRRFNQEAAGLPAAVAVLTVSLDLQPGFVNVGVVAPIQIQTITINSHLKNPRQTDPQHFADTSLMWLRR